MQPVMCVQLLQQIQAIDEETDKKNFEKHGAASMCHECGANTFVGRYPFWHRFGRNLCSSCGEEYIKMLKAIGAWD